MQDTRKRLQRLLVAHLKATGKEVPPELKGVEMELEAEKDKWVGKATVPKSR